MRRASYLKTLSEEAGEPFDDTLNKADASLRIDALQQETGRGGLTLRILVFSVIVRRPTTTRSRPAHGVLDCFAWLATTKGGVSALAVRRA